MDAVRPDQFVPLRRARHDVHCCISDGSAAALLQKTAVWSKNNPTDRSNNSTAVGKLQGYFRTPALSYLAASPVGEIAPDDGLRKGPEGWKAAVVRKSPVPSMLRSPPATAINSTPSCIQNSPAAPPRGCHSVSEAITIVPLRCDATAGVQLPAILKHVLNRNDFSISPMAAYW